MCVCGGVQGQGVMKVTHSSVWVCCVRACVFANNLNHCLRMYGNAVPVLV